jgi:glutathione peroxidase
MKQAKKEGGIASAIGNNIKWNFAKFLVDSDGKVVQRYLPTTSPLGIEADIKRLLK